MTTKKQAKAQALKRQQAYEERIAAKRRKREHGIRVTAIVVIAALVLGGGLAVLLVALNNDGGSDAAASTEESTSEATSGSDMDVDVVSGWAASAEPPDPSYAEDRTWTATLATSQGDLVAELDGAAAPQAVASFVALAEEGYFDGTECHRLTTAGIYVLQCGDPTATGTGGPNYRYGPIENAPEDDVYPAGTIAMARVGGDGESMGSQFFIVYEDSTIPSDSAGGYTVLGQLVDGTDKVVAVADAGTITGDTDGRPAKSVIVNEVSVS
ncbi:peptidylprolyl isomerase [Demequina mangrovi]|uniref:Peptidyl-prolyl cis-trans isomerase B (Cyclophilin B) n=1 Tax=Demequina mangrovi TaxID=1043493 RepID=A0A1H6U3W6_9MICO|nr:peptidylprolyl isomerase [Demequina mangrovi]SEI87003.1 peptidyl-prolyl cis-trans isomerase B (cyclophilin B) [Demequina mangrovi]